MKKLALTIVCALATAGAAFAQQVAGSYNFNQGAAEQVTTNAALGSMFGGNGTQLGANNAVGTAVGAPAFTFAILREAYTGTITQDTNVWDGTWTFTGILATNKPSGQPGTLINVNNAAAPNWTSDAVNNAPTNQFIMVGWSDNLGSSWLVVSNELATDTFTLSSGVVGFFGVSSVGDIALDGASSIGFNLFGGVQSYGNPIDAPFTLFAVPVPEPGTMALAGLGGLSLLLFRRQRK